MISVEESWKHHTRLGLESEGVLAVTVRECEAESLPVCPSPHIFPEHAHIEWPDDVQKAGRIREVEL
jgi:hypothetical protein